LCCLFAPGWQGLEGGWSRLPPCPTTKAQPLSPAEPPLLAGQSCLGAEQRGRAWGRDGAVPCGDIPVTRENTLVGDTRTGQGRASFPGSAAREGKHPGERCLEEVFPVFSVSRGVTGEPSGTPGAQSACCHSGHRPSWTGTGARDSFTHSKSGHRAAPARRERNRSRGPRGAPCRTSTADGSSPAPTAEPFVVRGTPEPSERWLPPQQPQQEGWSLPRPPRAKRKDVRNRIFLFCHHCRLVRRDLLRFVQLAPRAGERQSPRPSRDLAAIRAAPGEGWFCQGGGRL